MLTETEKHKNRFKQILLTKTKMETKMSVKWKRNYN